MTQIIWKRGVFYVFTAQMKIRVGGLNGMPSVDIQSGDEFEYDGSICKYSGAEFPQPGLRGAIREGWATADPKAGIPMAKSASRNVAAAQSVNTDLSRVQRQSGNSQISRDDDEETVLEVGDRQAVMNQATRQGHLTAKHNRRAVDTRGMEVNLSDIDDQEGIEIGRIKSQAKIKVDVLNNPDAARQIEMRSSDDGYGRFAGQRRITRQEGVQVMTEVGSYGSEIGGEENGEVVAEVRTVESRSTKDTSVKAAKKSKEPKENLKLIQAVKICSNFPEDWNFFGKVDDKLARLKEIKPTSDLLDALWAAESGPTKKALQKAYPKHEFK